MSSTNGSRQKGGMPPRYPQLTEKETEVLALLRDGLTNKQISERLNIRPSIVKQRLTTILNKLGSFSKDEAIAAAIQRGIILREG